MASLAMASSVAVVSLSSPCVSSPVFSPLSSVRLASTPLASPLRLYGASSRNLYVVAMATPQSKSLEGAVEDAIKEANEVCAAEAAPGTCAAAWDEVEELAAAIAHKRAAEKENKDPLEEYCRNLQKQMSAECTKNEDGKLRDILGVKTVGNWKFVKYGDPALG